MFSAATARRFVRFGVIGAVATALHYAILITGVEGLRADPLSASAVGFSVSAVANYILNYRLTFNSQKSHLVAGSRFAIVASCGLALNVSLMWLCTKLLLMPYLLGQVIATLMVLVFNFAGNSSWTFVDDSRDAAAARPRDGGKVS